ARAALARLLSRSLQGAGRRRAHHGRHPALFRARAQVAHPPMLRGSATPTGTAAYRAGHVPSARHGQFREWRGLALSSVGIGTYLGSDDDETDAQYMAAVERALLSGINVTDSAVNYRHQRSERAVGRALGRVIADGRIAREGVVVATKGGFLPFEGP